MSEARARDRGARLRAVVQALILVGLIARAGRAGDVERPLFERDVRPLLVGRCLDCHSGEKPAGGLDLSTAQGLFKGSECGAGRRAGRPRSQHAGDVVAEGLMPPKRPTGSRRGMAVLEDWITAGPPGRAAARARQHHDRPPRGAGLVVAPAGPRPAGPPARREPTGSRNPIDAFVLARLEARRARRRRPRPTAAR